MKTLALDTSGVSESVAVLVDEKVQGQHFQPSISSHTEILIPAIQACLQQSGCSFQDLDLLALTIGPGSFTGLRIGIATVKGLCAVTPKPVAPVSTLKALANPFLSSRSTTIVVQDARLKEVYAAAYFGEQCLWAPALLKLEEFFIERKKIPMPQCLVGSALKEHEEPFQELEKEVQLISDPPPLSAEVVARLGETMHYQKETIHSIQLTPLYLRVSEAERRLHRMK